MTELSQHLIHALLAETHGCRSRVISALPLASPTVTSQTKVIDPELHITRGTMCVMCVYVCVRVYKNGFVCLYVCQADKGLSMSLQ